MYVNPRINVTRCCGTLAACVYKNDARVRLCFVKIALSQFSIPLTDTNVFFKGMQLNARAFLVNDKLMLTYDKLIHINSKQMRGHISL